MGETQYIRSYVHLKDAYYGESNLENHEYIDVVTLSINDSTEKCLGEINVCWYTFRDGTLAARLESFDDTWHALLVCQDVLKKMSDWTEMQEDLGRSHLDALSPKEFCALLDSCGFEDKTPRTRE